MDDLEVVVGRRRGRTWRRVGYGLYRRQSGDPPEPTDRLGLRRQRLADLRAWQEVLPSTACFTHLTGAEVHGLWLPPLPDKTPVWVAQPKTETRVKRPEVRVVRPSTSFHPLLIGGLRAAPLAELLLCCARDLGLLDLIVLIDSALSRVPSLHGTVHALAGTRRWGAPALREVLPLVDARAESSWKSVLRVFHVLCEVPVEPQHVIYDDRGAFVARADLRLVGTRSIHEYDGAGHRDRRTHSDDLARDRRLVNNGWVRRGYTSADLLGRAHLILREADAALGRPHDPRRLEPWLMALQDSLFSSTGRRRLLERRLT